ncbi:type VI secretion system Vgr family protein [Caenispirillum bisanense]|uniref:Type VI secretion system secreted protein VgrG n=1 Tax=Caenispirillum bisanense TaxID=414052 RepID=A0A286GZ99_9PROT|nr:type VI secretion system tip protein VgrG [Caenispirillum bisanense]SOE00394.1 type VI secretion system secreted protein VgrG [Caenispirillum bisanense]
MGLLSKDLTQGDQYFSISTPLGKDKVILREMEGEEWLSGCFYYKLTMIAEDEDLSFDKVIGKAATITVRMTTDEDKRYITGIITSFELIHFDEREGLATYEAELRPWLWLLNLSGDCRIFQNKSVPEIIEEVCKGAGYPHVKKSLSGTYAKREYCVQYGESDFNFISRLMEEEGIFYYFSHTISQCQMVIGDGSSAFKSCPSVSNLTYRPTRAFDDEDDYLTSVRYSRQVTTKTVGLDSFNFETPSTDLYAKAQGTKGIGTVNSYTGRYLKSKEGEKYAKVLMEAAAADGEIIKGSGRARSLVAGYKFKIKEHPRSSVNAEYVLRRLRVSATRTDYTASFEAFPASKSFRPPQTAFKPRIHSSQTAIVVGKSGEEIWVDKYGRVKVQFHWDREGKKDDKSSCWIRVSQGWAGKAFGAMFLPRVGMEVIVSFLEGDPDQPIVTGAVYNAEQTIPYTLPANSTKSTVKTLSSKQGTGKFNEIRFEDKKDSEEIYVHAEKDMNVEVLNDLTRTIKHDLTQTIENNHTTTVKKDKTTTVQEGNEVHKVEKGTRDVAVKDNETHNNDADFTHKVAGNYELTVDGNLTITVTGDVIMKGKSLTFQSTSAGIATKSATTTDIEAGTALTTKAGTAATHKSGTAMTVESGTAMDIKSSMAMNVQSSMGMNLKANLNFQAEGLQTTVKGSAMGTVDGGGMLMLKGGLVKIG